MKQVCTVTKQVCTVSGEVKHVGLLQAPQSLLDNWKVIILIIKHDLTSPNEEEKKNIVEI